MGRSMVMMVLATCACSGSPGATNDDARGGTGGVSSSGGAGGGESRERGGTPASSGAAGDEPGGGAAAKWQTIDVHAPVTPRADLNISQSTEDKQSFSYSLYAKFAMKRLQWDGCTKHQLEECWYYECPVGSNPVGSLDDSRSITVGHVTIENGALVHALALEEEHYSGHGDEPFWPLSGGTVYFQAEQGHPAFRLDSKTPPTVWLQNVNGQSTPTMVKRRDGARVEWEASGAGTAFFSIYRFTGNIPAAVCTFDAASGNGTMPAAVLQNLEPGEDYRLTLRGDQRINAAVDGFEIEASLFGYGRPLTPLKVSVQ